MTITLRKEKGHPLTYQELDENFRDIDEDTDLQRVLENGNTTTNDIILTGSAQITGNILQIGKEGADYYGNNFTVDSFHSNNNHIISINTSNKLISSFLYPHNPFISPGMIIQTQKKVLNTSYTISTTSSLLKYSLSENFSCSITPKYKNSKILVNINLNYSTSNSFVNVFLTKNGNIILDSLKHQNELTGNTDYGYNSTLSQKKYVPTLSSSNFDYSFLDSPNTLEETVYSLSVRSDSNLFRVNYDSEYISSIFLMEIAQ
jgi:hypothetical protein